MPWQAWRRKGTRSSYNEGAHLGLPLALAGGGLLACGRYRRLVPDTAACGPAREVIEHPQHERLQKFLQRYLEV